MACEQNSLKKIFAFLVLFLMLGMTFSSMSAPVYARNAEAAEDDYTGETSGTKYTERKASMNAKKAVSSIENITNFFATVMQAAGVALTVYAIGKLVMAFTNDDATSKMNAAALIGTGVVFIVLPQIIKSLNLTQYL